MELPNKMVIFGNRLLLEMANFHFLNANFNKISNSLLFVFFSTNLLKPIEDIITYEPIFPDDFSSQLGYLPD